MMCSPVACRAGPGWAWRRALPCWVPGQVGGFTGAPQTRLQLQALEALWAQTFTGPQGEPVAMASFRGRKLVIEFWATWCPPCIEELPMLNAFHLAQQAKGWTVLGLAVDQLEPVQRFLKRQPLAFPVAVLGAQGLAVTQSFGNASGSLPYTAVVGAEVVMGATQAWQSERQ